MSAELLMRELAAAHECLREAEAEAAHGLTANGQVIDRLVTDAREAVCRAMLAAAAFRSSPTAPQEEK